MLLYYSVTKAPNNSDSFILGFSKVSICSCKSKCITRNKNSLIIIANATIKNQNNSDPLIPVALTESIRSCKNKPTNTKNNDNKWDGILTHICAIGRWHFQKNYNIVIKNDLNESKKKEISNTIDEDTKKIELETSNSSIKIYVPVLLNLSALNSTKHSSILLPVLSMLNLIKHNYQSSFY